MENPAMFGRRRVATKGTIEMAVVRTDDLPGATPPLSTTGRPVVHPDVPILRLLGYALFERQEDGTFLCLGWPSHWSDDEQRSASDEMAGQGHTTLAAILAVTGPFLDEFWIDAQSLWSRGRPGRIRSGVWEQEFVGRGIRWLEAVAVQTDDKSYLLVEDKVDRGIPGPAASPTPIQLATGPIRAE